jgi:hypothetical protein
VAVVFEDEPSEATIASAEMCDFFVTKEKVKHVGEKVVILRTRLEPTENVALTSRGGTDAGTTRGGMQRTMAARTSCSIFVTAQASFTTSFLGRMLAVLQYTGSDDADEPIATQTSVWVLRSFTFG